MADGGLFVYKCARDAHEQITRLSDFMSPTIVAMWNLRWQVQGFLLVKPDATQEDLVQRFASGADIKGNEIKRACVTNTWEDQEARFALILLTNTIAIFEEFLESLVGLSLSGDKKHRAVKALQFPVAPTGRNYQSAYNMLGPPVPELANVFNSGSAIGRWYSGAHLQNLLLCYRFFKEIRNAWTHSGGRATAEIMSAYSLFKPIATKAQLGIKEVPIHSAPVLNDVFILELRSAYAFSDIVLRLVATYDRDLSDRKGALIDVDRRLKSLKPTDRTHTTDAMKRKRLLDGLFRNSKMPAGNKTLPLMEFLKRTDRIPSHW